MRCFQETLGLQTWGAAPAVDFTRMGELLAGARWRQRQHARKGAAVAITAWQSAASPARLMALHHPRAGASGCSSQSPSVLATEQVLAGAPAREGGANDFLRRFDTMWMRRPRQSMPVADLPLPTRNLES